MDLSLIFSPCWGPRMSTSVLCTSRCRPCHNQGEAESTKPSRGKPASHPDTRNSGLGQFARMVLCGVCLSSSVFFFLVSLWSPVIHEGPSQSGHCASRIEGRPSPLPTSGISSTLWFSHTQGSHFLGQDQTQMWSAK